MERFIPFLLAFEAGLSSKVCIYGSNLLRYNEARKRGWSDDPRDAGGATMCGVTLNTYKSYCRRKGLPTPTKNTLRNLPYSHWRDIVGEFWKTAGGPGILCEPVAWLVADWVWGSGPKILKLVQETVNRLVAGGSSFLAGAVGACVERLKTDGVIGQKSLAAINSLDGRALFDCLWRRRLEYIDSICRERPVNEAFRRGWTRRLEAIKYEGLVY